MLATNTIKNIFTKTRSKVAVCIIFLFAFFVKWQTSHAQLVFLSTESITPLEPILMNDTIDFQVQVGVTNFISLLPDIAIGNIFYWYRTDSMINSGQPARLVDFNLSVQLVSDGFLDTVPIEMKPNELRMGGTNPVNLIILWPAMINPLVVDTTGGVTNIVVDGYLGDNPYPQQVGNIIFPCPALQYIYIKHEEIIEIKQLSVISMDGQLIQTYENEEFKNGFINLENYATGNYVVRCTYYNGNVIQTQILKH